MRFQYPVSVAAAASAIVAPHLAGAFDLPTHLASFYDLTKNGGCKSFYEGRSDFGDGQGNIGYGFCDDTPGAIYISGRRDLGDMDVDCDGADNCGPKNKDYQSGTSFDDTLKAQSYSTPTKSLNASSVPYVVLGTCDLAMATSEGGPVPPLSVVAVVCNNELHYGIFGDTNGCDDDNFTGEASIGLARMCFPDEELGGDKGHTDHDVLYLAFTSEKAVPGPKGAKWDAKTPEEFEASIKHLGDQMLDELFKTSTGRTKEGDVGDYGKDKKGAAANLKGCVPVGIMIVAGMVTMINLMA